MRRLCGFIDKEKQADALADKLVQRFPEASRSVSKTARDISFCISQLRLPRRRKKFTESWKMYEECLYDAKTTQNFQSMFAKMKRVAKSTEFKQFIDEFDAKMSEAHAEGGSVNARQSRREGRGRSHTAESLKRRKKKQKCKKAKRRTRRRGRRRRKVEDVAPVSS